MKTSKHIALVLLLLCLSAVIVLATSYTSDQIWNFIFNQTDNTIKVSLSKSVPETPRSISYTGAVIMNEVYNATDGTLKASVDDLGDLEFPTAFSNISTTAAFSTGDVIIYDGSLWTNKIITPIPTPSPIPTATPKPDATPIPTATPKPDATPQPTATPDPLIPTALQKDGSIPLNNNTFLTGRNATNDGNVNVVKVNASNTIDVGANLNIDGIKYGNGLNIFGNYSTLSDDSQVLLPAGTGRVSVICGDGTEWGEIVFASDGTVILTANSTNFVNTDTDAKCCAYDAGSNQVALKNRLGSTQVISWFGNYR